MAQFSVCGKDFGSMMTDIKLKLVRTYKGEIKRTQTGIISTFPLSFVTVGFDVKFQGLRQDMKLLQQLMLSADVVTVVTDYDGVALKGSFSCTTNEYVELKDRNEERTTLALSIVSDGTNITKPAETAFSVRLNSSTGTQLATGYYGKVVTLSGVYKKNGATLPNKQILVLGDEIVTA